MGGSMDREFVHPVHGVTKETGECNMSMATWTQCIKKEVVMHKNWHRHYGQQYHDQFGVPPMGREAFGAITPDRPSTGGSRASSRASRPRTAQDGSRHSRRPDSSTIRLESYGRPDSALRGRREQGGGGRGKTSSKSERKQFLTKLQGKLVAALNDVDRKLGDK